MIPVPLGISQRLLPMFASNFILAATFDDLKSLISLKPPNHDLLIRSHRSPDVPASTKHLFIINLVGMSICPWVLHYGVVNFEYNADFDRQQVNAGKIYRVAFWQAVRAGRVPYGVCPLPAGELLRQNLKDGDELIQYFGKDGQFRIGDEMFQRQVVYADPSFSRIFTVELLYGRSPSTTKIRSLSATISRKHFMTKPMLWVNHSHKWSPAKTREYVVGGVFKKFPGNSSFRFHLLTNYENYFADPAARIALENDWSRLQPRSFICRIPVR